MEGGGQGKLGQVSESERSLGRHGAAATRECWMALVGWRASFPLVVSDHRHY